MQPNELQHFSRQWLPEVEQEMRRWVADCDPALATYYSMMRYHLGWADEQFHAQTAPSGKRLRPLLCLLACAAVGGDPCQAVPAAAAIELFHNYSLIHDDIEDGDELRRHRPTVWKVWGKQGDLLFKSSGAFQTSGDGNIVDLQYITGGTGDFSGVTGVIRASGTFNSATNMGESEYEGMICLP